jgi:DNA replication protein DnaC
MSTTNVVDTARLNLLLNELRLPAIKALWPQFAEQSDIEGWPAARFLATIAEHEIAERGRRRIERHLVEARLPTGKTFDSFDFEAVPMISKAQMTALAAGDGWLGKGANLLLFGPPGGGKSHLAAAIGLALIENGWRVLFTRTTDLAASSTSRAPSTASIASISSSWTILPMSPRTRPRPVCCSSSSAHATSDALC